MLVSSGAMASGMGPLRMKHRPRDLASKQAAASVGQSLLVGRYSSLFARHDITVGQVLLTVEDVARQDHYRNALRTFTRLLELGVVPVVNENDTVATHEIKFGDNDRLAALVAHLVGADALVLLSDVDSLYTAHPSSPDAQPIAVVDDIEDLDVDTSGRGAAIGTGGMETKLQAARIATASGIPVVLAAATSVGRRTGRRTGRHAVPGHRQAARPQADVAGLRVDRPGRTGAGRRCGEGAHRAQGVPARCRHHRRPRHLRRRRPGPPGVGAGQGDRPRPGRLRRERADRHHRPEYP